MSTYQELVQIFESAKGAEYLGEDITLVEHMIQCGELARKTDAPEWLVVAALLHDIGHMLIPDAQEAQDSGEDRHHDEVGADWLAQRFPENLVEAVRLHVDAKKYLVATEPEYLDKLSEASRITLAIQGGIFTPEECAEFLRQPYAGEAIDLRRWDDEGKVRGASGTSLEPFRSAIEAVAL
jgi:[1-hydroxy-2-(trimethylamino)ethyl]phosphonate dioxygenase